MEYAVVYAQENGSPCQDISVGWPAAFSMLRECWREGGTALVHCKAGMNRSVTTAAAFLLAHGVFPSWEAAVCHIRCARPAVQAGNDGVPAPYPYWFQEFGAAFVAREAAKNRLQEWRAWFQSQPSSGGSCRCRPGCPY